jgi:hypothetical protein
MIMLKIFKQTIFFSILLILSSCVKEPPAELTLSASEVILSNIDGQEKILVSSNGKWTATIASQWCTISPMSGDGNGEITITATNNTSTEQRSVTLTVVSRNLTKTASVKQSFAELELDRYDIQFSKEPYTKNITITSNTKWQLEIPYDAGWITASVLSGEGNREVTFNFSQNTGAERSAYVNVNFSNTYKSLRVTQERGKNSAPSAPALKSPVNNLTDANKLPTFRWSTSKDPDNDEVTYRIEYSPNQNSWTYFSTLKDSVYNLPAYLDDNKKYYWRVSASDAFGGISYSDVYTFTTGTKKSYFDGQYKVAQENTLGTTPSEILFLGDGYISEDYEEGGLFDKDMDEGIEHFFSVEPYKSYREYFKVYKQAGYSRDSGVKQTDKSISKNSKFNTDFLGGSSMSTNTDLAFDYARMIPGVDNNKLKTLLIIMVVNQNRYAGTCWMWSDGKSVAIVPVSKSTSPGAHYRNLMIHEASGHGYGRLADEYVSSANAGKTLPEEEKVKFNNWVKSGFYPNVDLTSDVTAIKWKHFIDKPGYGRVSAFQGAFYYTFGAWRPETSSVMIQNEPYFNAPSREFIVKRILTTAGLEFSFDAFVDRDIEKAPSQAAIMQTKSINPLTFVPLAPPVMVE